MITYARNSKLVTPEDRNELLCSNRSPLNNEEKSQVRAKLQTRGTIFRLIPAKSGQFSFTAGIELFKIKMRQNNTQPSQSFTTRSNI